MTDVCFFLIRQISNHNLTSNIDNYSLEVNGDDFTSSKKKNPDLFTPVYTPEILLMMNF